MPATALRRAGARRVHCRPRTAATIPIDSCASGRLTAARIAGLLEHAYRRFLADCEQSPVAPAQDAALGKALRNCVISDGRMSRGRRADVPLTRKERFIRLAHAAWLRLEDLPLDPIVLADDLELLDALRDAVEGWRRFDWTIDRDCELWFT